MNNEGALFDMGKLNFFARELLAKLNKDEITKLALDYASKYNEKLYKTINENPAYFTAIMNIDREKVNPRKDYEKFGNILDIIAYFFPDGYQKEISNGLTFNEKFSKQDIVDSLKAIKANLKLDQDEQSWFNNLKEIGVSLNFASNNKEYKANPEQFKGNIGDLAEILRITLTGRKNAPNLYSVMVVLGLEESHRRIDYVISLLNK
jgi:glutamyl-tRNA synthetase